MRKYLFVVLTVISILSASSCNGDIPDFGGNPNPKTADWNDIKKLSFCMKYKPDLPIKDIPDGIEIGKSFRITARQAQIDGLNEGDFDAISPVVNSIISRFKQIFEVEGIFLDGKKALMVTSTKVNANFFGVFMPLENRLVSVYTSLLALDKDAETAKLMVLSLSIKTE